MSRTFEYRHQVGLEETNLVGNVYFANFVRWQGRCREMFLMRYAREIADELGRGLILATTRCECDFREELAAFDEVIVAMHLDPTTRQELRLGSNQSRLTLRFDYYRIDRDPDGRELRRTLVATGSQGVACLRADERRKVSCPFPGALLEAMSHYL